ncbi:hypothetical protein XU18_0474 [Perkinsela sp. CCAP 1560/4]|nr:hypothetical protein XU18_0474 [Perkinsela sp. CCAP 1560/4]|eukprot:KNH09789.1 hypothetical protein XU18_0474 [Perkinsela sp. CCAP 1560/4]
MRANICVRLMPVHKRKAEGKGHRSPEVLSKSSPCSQYLFERSRTSLGLKAITKICRKLGFSEHSAIRSYAKEHLLSMSFAEIINDDVATSMMRQRARADEFAETLDEEMQEYLSQCNSRASTNFSEIRVMRGEYRQFSNALMFLQNATALHVDIENPLVKNVLRWIQDCLEKATESLNTAILERKRFPSPNQRKVISRSHFTEEVKIYQSTSDPSPSVILCPKIVVGINKVYMTWMRHLNLDASKRFNLPDIFLSSVPFFMRIIGCENHRVRIEFLSDIVNLCDIYRATARINAEATGSFLQRSLFKGRGGFQPFVQVYMAIADRIVATSGHSQLNPSKALALLRRFFYATMDMSYSIFSRDPPTFKTLELHLVHGACCPTDEQRSISSSTTLDKLLPNSKVVDTRKTSHPIFYYLFSRLRGGVSSLTDGEYMKLGMLLKSLWSIRAPPITYAHYLKGENYPYPEVFQEGVIEMIAKSKCRASRKREVLEKMDLMLEGIREQLEQYAQRSQKNSSVSFEYIRDVPLNDIEAIMHGIQSSAHNLIEEQSEVSDAPHKSGMEEMVMEADTTEKKKPEAFKISKLYRHSLTSLEKYLDNVFQKRNFTNLSAQSRREVDYLKLEESSDTSEVSLSDSAYDRLHCTNNDLEGSFQLLLRRKDGTPLLLKELLSIVGRIAYTLGKICLYETELDEAQQAAKFTNKSFSPIMPEKIFDADRVISRHTFARLLFLVRNLLLCSPKQTTNKKQKCPHSILVNALRSMRTVHVIAVLDVISSPFATQAHPLIVKQLFDACYCCFFLPLKAGDPRPLISCPLRIFRLLSIFQGHVLSSDAGLDVQRDQELPSIREYYFEKFGQLVETMSLQSISAVLFNLLRSKNKVATELATAEHGNTIINGFLEKGRVEVERSEKMNPEMCKYEMFELVIRQFISIVEKESVVTQHNTESLSDDFAKQNAPTLHRIIYTFLSNCTRLRSSYWHPYHLYGTSMHNTDIPTCVIYKSSGIAPFAPSVDAKMRAKYSIFDEATLFETHQQLKKRIKCFAAPKHIPILSKFSPSRDPGLFLDLLRINRQFLFVLCPPKTVRIDREGCIELLSEKDLLLLLFNQIMLGKFVYSHIFSPFSPDSYLQTPGDQQMMQRARWELLENEECERRVMRVLLARLVGNITKEGVFAESIDYRSFNVYTVRQLCQISQMLAHLEVRRWNCERGKLQGESKESGHTRLSHFNTRFRQYFSTHSTSLAAELPPAPSLVAIFASLLPLLEVNIHRLNIDEIFAVGYSFYVYSSPNKRFLDALAGRQLDAACLTEENTAQKVKKSTGKNTTSTLLYDDSNSFRFISMKALMACFEKGDFLATIPIFYCIKGYRPPVHFSAFCFRVLMSLVQPEPRAKVGAGKNPMHEISDYLKNFCSGLNADKRSNRAKKSEVAVIRSTIFSTIANCVVDDSTYKDLPLALQPPPSPLLSGRVAAREKVFQLYAPHTIAMLLYALPSMVLDLVKLRQTFKSLSGPVEYLAFSMIRHFIIPECSYRRTDQCQLPLLLTEPNTVILFFDALSKLLEVSNSLEHSFCADKSKGSTWEMVSTIRTVIHHVFDETVLQVKRTKGLIKCPLQKRFLPSLASISVLCCLSETIICLHKLHGETGRLVEVYNLLMYTLENDSDGFPSVELENLRRECGNCQKILLSENSV